MAGQQVSGDPTGSAFPANAFGMGIKNGANLSALTAGQSTMANSIPVTIASDNTGTVEITDGTNIANVLKSDGTAAGQNSQLVAGTYLSVPFTTTTVQAVGTTDAGNYNYVSVHTTTQGTSSNIIFQGSNDNTNWVSVVLLITSATGSTSQNISTSGAARIDSGPLNFRYFRLNVTGISAGTTAGTIIFRTQAPPMIAQSTQVGSNSATGSAVPANAFFMGLLGASGNLEGSQSVRQTADGATGNGIASQQPYVYNGTTFDRGRSATAASNTTGTGLLGVGLLGFDGTNYQKLTTTGTGSGALAIGTASAVVNVGQQTSNTSAVQLSASSTVPTNGIVIEALIANAAVVYIGGSGVTTSTGFQLSPGQSLTLTCNLNTIYVIGSNATDKVCWSVA